MSKTKQKGNTFTEDFLSDVPKDKLNKISEESLKSIDAVFPQIKELLDKANLYKQFKKRMLGGTDIKGVFCNNTVVAFANAGNLGFDIYLYCDDSVICIDYHIASKVVRVSECHEVKEGCKMYKWKDILVHEDYEETSPNTYRYSNIRPKKPDIIQIEFVEPNITMFYDVKRKLFASMLTKDMTKALAEYEHQEDVCEDNNIYARRFFVSCADSLYTKLFWYNSKTCTWEESKSFDIVTMCSELWDSTFTNKDSDLSLIKKAMLEGDVKNCCDGTVSCAFGAKFIEGGSRRKTSAVHAIKNIVPLTYDEYNRRYNIDPTVDYTNI